MNNDLYPSLSTLPVKSLHPRPRLLDASYDSNPVWFRLVRVRVVIGIWSLAILVLLSGSAQADGPHRAGLVVRFGGEQTQTACVSFSEESITGIELLRRAGFSLVTGYAGAAVCKINDLGCPADNCFCQSFAPPYAYWAYFHSGGDGNWTYSNVGGGGYHVKAGQVEGWSWGPGESAPPPRLSFDQVCPAPTAMPSATPATQPTATVTPLPTRTPTRLPPTLTPELPAPTLPPTDSPASPTTAPPPTQTPANTTPLTPRLSVPLPFTPTRRPTPATLPPPIQSTPGLILAPVSPTAPPTPVVTHSPEPSQTPTPEATLLTETVIPSRPPATSTTVPPASPTGQPWVYGVFGVIVVGLVGLLFFRSRRSREEP